MKRSISLLMFSTTLIVSSQQIFAVTNNTTDNQRNKNLTTDGFGALPASRAGSTRLIIAETQISDQMDPRTQAPVSTTGTTSEGTKKSGPEGTSASDVKKPAHDDKAGSDAKKSGAKDKAASGTKKSAHHDKPGSHAKKSGTEGKAASEAKTPAPVVKTTPDVKKSGSEGKATSDVKKSTAEGKAASEAKTPAPVVKTTPDVKKSGSEGKATSDAKTPVGKTAPAAQPASPAGKTAPATQPPVSAGKTAPATQPASPVGKTAPATQPPVSAGKTAPATKPSTPAGRTAPATGMGAPGPRPNQPQSGVAIHENCISFDPGHLSIVRAGHHWAVVGNSRLLHFSRRRSAQRALSVIQHYGMSKQCFVGSPRPLFRYYLTNSRAPNAPRLRGEHCVAFSPALIHIRRARNGRWVLAEGRRYLFRFRYNRREASKALSILRKYTFNHACYVGHGSHAMRYILQR